MKADTNTDTNTDSDTNTNTDTDTDTNTDGGMIMGEVSLQKSYPYWKAHGAGQIQLCCIFFLKCVSWQNGWKKI